MQNKRGFETLLVLSISILRWMGWRTLGAAKMDGITASELLEFKGLNRTARAYAFLYASFEASERSGSPVRDAFDCVAPFIIPYLNNTKGQQVDVVAIQSFLRSSFFFDIPLYTIEQLLPLLSATDHVKYDKTIRRYISIGGKDLYSVSKERIGEHLDRCVIELTEYASQRNFEQTPDSENWERALIRFLKSTTDENYKKFINVKGAIIPPIVIEEGLIASFIRDAQIETVGF